MDEAGGPDTLLHGDLGPKNIFVALASDGPCARLVDWDHVGVGPAGYDVSTLLYQSSQRSDLGYCRSEEHTSELQSQSNLVCRLLLEKKKHNHDITSHIH